MEQPFFSVIIPVYKVEEYIRECVDSVLSQTFNNIEVILVDDGSPDNCPAICDEYTTKNPKVRVIHKENGGLSDARNWGIRAASGRYLMFLDSDDYWDDSDALRKIHTSLQKGDCTADVVLFQAKLVYPDGTVIPDTGRFFEDFNSMSPENALVYMSEHGLLIGSACSKVVRRSFLIDNNLFFKPGIKSEDIDWIIRLADCLPKYNYSDQYFYIYRKGRSESITANADAAYLNQFADMLEKFSSDFAYSSDTTAKCLISLVAYEFSILMAKTANLSDKAQKKLLIERIRNMKDVLKYDMHPKTQAVNKVKRILGFDITMMLLGVYLKYRKR